MIHFTLILPNSVTSGLLVGFFLRKKQAIQNLSMSHPPGISDVFKNGPTNKNDRTVIKPLVPCAIPFVFENYSGVYFKMEAIKTIPSLPKFRNFDPPRNPSLDGIGLLYYCIFVIISIICWNDQRWMGEKENKLNDVWDKPRLIEISVISYFIPILFFWCHARFRR